MKKIFITGGLLQGEKTDAHTRVRTFEYAGENCDASDGYHTFSELYEHRYALFIALARAHKDVAWRSKFHSNGTKMGGYFVMGIGKEAGKQITYHLPNELWPKTDDITTLEYAPEFDGHTPSDVLNRLNVL